MRIDSSFWLKCLFITVAVALFVNSTIILLDNARSPISNTIQQNAFLNQGNNVKIAQKYQQHLQKTEQSKVTAKNKSNPAPAEHTQIIEQKIDNVFSNQQPKKMTQSNMQKSNENLMTQLFETNKQKFNQKMSMIDSLNQNGHSKIEQYVRQIIQKNRQRIIEHNKFPKITYKLRQNKFIVYSSEQFKQMFLTLQPPNSTYIRHQPQNIRVILPQNSQTNKRRLQNLNINWRTARRMTSVKFQRQCGSCYSFTALAAIESAYILKGQLMNLAEQQIVDCSSVYGNAGCVGGWTINSYKYIKQWGVLHQSNYPYTATAGNCSIPEGQPKFWIKDYVELKNDCNMVIEALGNQPLSVAINADNWQYYSTGIYTDCVAGASNHGVILAGVDSQSWLIKNSWGFSWGEQGYIRIGRKAPNNACNVCQWASYPVL